MHSRVVAEAEMNGMRAAADGAGLGDNVQIAATPSLKANTKRGPAKRKLRQGWAKLWPVLCSQLGN